MVIMKWILLAVCVMLVAWPLLAKKRDDRT